MHKIEEIYFVSDITPNASNFTQLLELVDTQNSTNLNYEGPELRMNFAVLALIPLILVIAIGNIMVITLVGLDRRLRSATNCFLSSLAVADMLVALMVMPLSLAMIVNNYVWPFSDEACGLWVMLDVFFSTCSILHLCMISFDRYLALAQPFTSRHSRPSSYGNTKCSVASIGGQSKTKTLRRAGRRIFFVWSIALGIAIPIPILGRVDRNNLFVGDMCAINMAEFQIYGSLAAFFLPLVIMFIMYTLTIRTLKRQAQMVSNIMVQNSPPCSLPRSSVNRSLYSSFRRKSTQSKEYLKDPSQVHQLQYHGRVTGSNEDVFASDLQNKTQEMKKSCEKCRSKNEVAEPSEQEESWRKALRMITNLFRRNKRKNKRTNSSQTMNGLNNNEKCTCRNSNRNDDECNSKECTREALLLRQQSRSNRSNHGRVTSSFKNRAMASITNEQRASKVLGLIFVLFCVFWCPFFITNVTSRLCITCNQEVMGNLMNWFVWVGYVSSGVNPCVYTMFSRRFRRTFFLVMRGKFTQINKDRHYETSSISNGRTSTFSTRNSRVTLRPSTSANQLLKPSVSSLGEDDGIIKYMDKLQVFPQAQTLESDEDSLNTPKIWRWTKPKINETTS